jgi:hypothetical protein
LEKDKLSKSFVIREKLVDVTGDRTGDPLLAKQSG